MTKMTQNILICIIYVFCGQLSASDPVIVDTTGLDFQNYGYTGTFGHQIVVDDSGKVHVAYCKTWCTETDTGWQVMYANVTDGNKIPISNQYSYPDIKPGVVYIAGGHNNAPIYFNYGMGSRFYKREVRYSKYGQPFAKVSKDGQKIEILGVQQCDSYSGIDLICANSMPIALEFDNISKTVHCLSSAHSSLEFLDIGTNVGYWNYQEPNFGEMYQMFIMDPDNDIPGKDVPEKYRRNGTKGADLAVSSDGLMVAVATLHTACNIFLHFGKYGGEIWPDDFYEGLADGSVIALFDTTNSGTGENIPNNDPKPFTEVQVSYDENDNLHVVYDATFIDLYYDTSAAVSHLKHWWDNRLYGGAGDTNAVFYDGSKHPKPQLRYWNSITKTHILLAECAHPVLGESFKWFSFDGPEKSAASWGKFINDAPIANFDFFINKDRKPGEPLMVCVWEEMQGNVTVLSDAEKEFGYIYYAYMKDIKISVSDDGSTWSAPYNITNTPDRDEGEVSVYRDVIDNKIHLVYSEDGLPGSDLNLSYIDDYEDKYLQDWPPIEGHFSVPIRKETTEQVIIIYREFDLSTITNVKSFETNIPERFELAQNYPNPFNPTTTIAFSLPISKKVKISVYNIQGRLVETLLDEIVAAGPHQFSWDASHLSSGLYFYRIETDGFVKTKKCLLIK